jgi:hypothetical protein
MSDPMSTDPVPVNPAPKGLIAMVQAILLKPAQTWDAIAADSSQSVQSIYMGYVLPLAAIGPIARAIGMSVFGVGAFGFSYHTPILWSLIEAVVAYVLGLVLIYVEAFIIDMLAPSFDGQKNMLAAFKLAVYSSTAAWIAGIFGIFQMLGILGIVGLYSLYLLYIGLPKLMKSPPEKSVVYIIVIIVVMIVASIIPAMVAGAVGGMAGIGAMGAGLNGVTSNTPFNGGSVTVNGANGATATVNLNQMAAAANQMAAQASAVQNGTAASVKVADPNALLALMPASFNGATRSDTSTSSGGAAGLSAATATATYTIGDGNIHLTITDMGSASGIGALAGAMNVNSSSSSATGYDKITTSNGQMVEEEYDTQSKDGKYSILSNGRVSVAAEGSGVDIGTIKSLVSQIDIGKAQALTQ